MTFADDIVIFGEVILNNIQSMIRIVEKFCEAFGQRINFVKSQVICCDNLSFDVAHFLFEVKGFPKSPEALKYLGFPYIKDGRSIRALNKVLMDTQSKIEH